MIAEDGSVEAVGGSTRDISDRKRAEIQLRESEERATHIVESITDGFMTIDAEWRITDVESARRRDLSPFAKDQRQHSGQGFLGRISGHDWHDLRGKLFAARCASGSRWAYEGFLSRALESWFDAGLSLEGWPFADLLDIRGRKRAEAGLERAMVEAVGGAEANAKFRTFFDQGSYFAGVMTLDGIVVEANRIRLDTCGFVREEVIGRKFWECGWWNRSPELIEMVRAGSMQAAEGRLFRRETPVIYRGRQRAVCRTDARSRDRSRGPRLVHRRDRRGHHGSAQARGRTGAVPRARSGAPARKPSAPAI